jgi:superkiller protein 3
MKPISIRSLAGILMAATFAAGCGGSNKQAKLASQAHDMRVELAETYLSRGANEAAIPLLRRSLAEDPKNPRLRVMYGTVLRDLGLYRQAREQLKFALKLKPNDAAAHAALGILYNLRREPARALPHHQRAVELAPGHAPFYNNLGFALFLNGDLTAAISAYEQALALDPALAVAYNNLGFAYGRRGDYKQAEKTFRTIAKRPVAMLNMALVYDQHGDHDRASELRARAYKLDPDLRPPKQTDKEDEQ